MPRPYVGWHCCNDNHLSCNAATCVCDCHGRGVVANPDQMIELCNEFGLRNPHWRLNNNAQKKVKARNMARKISNDKFFLVINGDDGNIVAGPFTGDNAEQQATDEAKNLAAPEGAGRPKFYIVQSKAFVQRPAPEMPVSQIID